MTRPERQFRFSSRVAPRDPFHLVTMVVSASVPPDDHHMAPTTVKVNVLTPTPAEHLTGQVHRHR